MGTLSVAALERGVSGYILVIILRRRAFKQYIETSELGHCVSSHDDECNVMLNSREPLVMFTMRPERM